MTFQQPSPSSLTADSSHHATTSPGRKAVISRDDIIAAALKLLGPHRSLSTLSLREVAREAGIAPNSFYRHFRDMDELSVALIDLAGQSLRQIIGLARQRATTHGRVVRGSVEAFMDACVAGLGHVDILVPAAGTTQRRKKFCHAAVSEQAADDGHAIRPGIDV